MRLTVNHADTRRSSLELSFVVSEYIVNYANQAAGSGHKRVLTWNGSAAGSSLDESFTKKSMTAVVSAESTTEALAAIKQLYPGSITEGGFAVLKSSVTLG